MSSLGWSIEEDSFEQNTVVGRIRFTNIIATLDPNAPRRMVIACHYDSKVTPQGFLGATDSAAPCAQMINLAKTLQSELNNLKGKIRLNKTQLWEEFGLPILLQLWIQMPLAEWL